MFLLVKGLLGPDGTLPLPTSACSKFFLLSPTDCVLNIVDVLTAGFFFREFSFWQPVRVEADHLSPLRYSCLGNATKKGASWATVHGVAKSQARLSD